jgi:dihydroorotase
VFTGKTLRKKDIFCDNKIIVDNFEGCSPDEQIDAEGLVASPGFIDLHTHLREPGFTEKETIATGTLAAIAGGFTTVCSMPNLNPVPDNKKNLNIQQKIINKNAKCKVLPFMSITKSRSGKKITIPLKECVGISDDGDGVQDFAIMAAAMKQTKQNDSLISAHCEDKTLVAQEGACIHDGFYAKNNNLPGISSASEYAQIKRDLKLLKKNKCRYHICHISSKESVELVRLAKSEGLPVTCEVTPHHLLLCQDDIRDDGKFKMAPPLRAKEDREALVQGILDGTIDAIATDHAPHEFDKKNKGLTGSAMGVVGLECAFSVLHTELVLKNIITIEKLLSLLTFSPAKVIRANCGIYKGNSADITLIDLKKKWKINSQNFFSKGRSTPFDGKEVTGKIIYTIVNGKIAYHQNKKL